MQSLPLLEAFVLSIRDNCRSLKDANQFSTSSDNIGKWAELLISYKNDISLLKTPSEINYASENVLELLTQHTSLKDAKAIKNHLDSRNTLDEEMVALINKSRGGKLKPILKKAQKKALDLISNDTFVDGKPLISTIFTNISSVEMLEMFETIISYIELLEKNDPTHLSIINKFLNNSPSPEASFRFIGNEINKSSFSKVFSLPEDGKISFNHPSSSEPDSLLFVGKMVHSTDKKGNITKTLKPHGRLSMVTLQQYTAYEKIQLISHREIGKYFLNEINDVFRGNTEEPNSNKTHTQLVQDAIQLLKDQDNFKLPNINKLIIALAGNRITNPELIDLDSYLRIIVEEDLDVKTFTLNTSMDLFNLNSNPRKDGVKAVLNEMGLDPSKDTKAIQAFSQYLVLTSLGSSIFQTVEDYRLSTLGDDYSVSQDATSNVSDFINNIFLNSYVSSVTKDSIDTIALSKVDINTLETSFIDALDKLASTNPKALRSFLNADAPFNNFKFSMLFIYFSNKFPTDKISNILRAIPEVQHPLILLDKKDTTISLKDNQLLEKDNQLLKKDNELLLTNGELYYLHFHNPKSDFWNKTAIKSKCFSSIFSYLIKDRADEVDKFFEETISKIFFKDLPSKDINTIILNWKSEPLFLSKIIDFLFTNKTNFHDKKFNLIIERLGSPDPLTKIKNDISKIAPEFKP